MEITLALMLPVHIAGLRISNVDTVKMMTKGGEYHADRYYEER